MVMSQQMELFQTEPPARGSPERRAGADPRQRRAIESREVRLERLFAKLRDEAPRRGYETEHSIEAAIDRLLSDDEKGAPDPGVDDRPAWMSGSDKLAPVRKLGGDRRRSKA